MRMRPTLSQLHLGKQAGTGAQSTFEADGRSPEPHLWRPLASRMSHEEGGRTPRRHTHIYSPLGHLATPCRTKVRFSLCTPRDRLLVKVPRLRLRHCRSLPLVAVIIQLFLPGEVHRPYPTGPTQRRQNIERIVRTADASTPACSERGQREAQGRGPHQAPREGTGPKHERGSGF